MYGIWWNKCISFNFMTTVINIINVQFTTSWIIYLKLWFNIENTLNWNSIMYSWRWNCSQMLWKSNWICKLHSLKWNKKNRTWECKKYWWIMILFKYGINKALELNDWVKCCGNIPIPMRRNSHQNSLAYQILHSFFVFPFYVHDLLLLVLKSVILLLKYMLMAQ